MALPLLARTTERVVVVSTADPAVRLRLDAEAALRKRLGVEPPAPLPPTWVPMADCIVDDNATHVTMRPLSWLEDQALRVGRPDHEFMLEYLRAAVVAIDGDADLAARFVAAPAPAAVIGLWRVAHEITWGNR